MNLSYLDGTACEAWKIFRILLCVTHILTETCALMLNIMLYCSEVLKWVSAWIIFLDQCLVQQIAKQSMITDS